MKFILFLAASVWAASALAKPQQQMWSFSMSRGRLGVEVMTMSEELRAHFGAPKDAGILVNRVEADTPAQRAGVKVGDVIVAIGNAPVDEASDVFSALGGKKKGDKAEVAVVRDKKRIVLTATLDDDDAMPFSKKGMQSFAFPFGKGGFRIFGHPFGEAGDDDSDKASPLVPLTPQNGPQNGHSDSLKDQLERARKQIESMEKRLQELEKNKSK